jgi:cell wall assembly regulator SMI1
MQKFTRALTREIEVGGERLAVTLSEEGLSVRPVGSRRPPHAMTWAAWVYACANRRGDGEPAPEAIAEALKALKAGAKAAPPAQADETPAETAPPAEEVSAAPAASSAPAEHTSAPAAGAAPAPAEKSLATLLERLDHWLKAHRPRFYPALLPGASAADLDGLSRALGAPLPDELRTWLTWHNGQDPDVVGAFEESWNLMSAGQIADAKKELDGAAHEGWDKAWIPFLDDDGGDYLVLDPTQPGAAVRECWQGRAEHGVVAPSLAAWVEGFLRALERGDYHEDPERGTFLRR